MAVTRTEVFKSARWLARMHAVETDALTASQWEACLGRAWRRLWGKHPQAFHVDGELVGQLPDLPAVNVEALPIVPDWIETLAVGIAADALTACAQSMPDDSPALATAIQGLEEKFGAGYGA